MTNTLLPFACIYAQAQNVLRVWGLYQLCFESWERAEAPSSLPLAVALTLNLRNLSAATFLPWQSRAPRHGTDVATLPQPAAALAVDLELSRQEGDFLLAPCSDSPDHWSNADVLQEVAWSTRQWTLLFSKRPARTAQSKGFRINIFMLHRTLQLQPKNPYFLLEPTRVLLEET